MTAQPHSHARPLTDKHNDLWRCHGTLLWHPSFEFIVFNPSFELIIFNPHFLKILVFQLYIKVATAKFLIPVFILCSLDRSDFLTHTIPNCLQIF